MAKKVETERLGDTPIAIGTLRERLQRIRKEVTYIKKTKLKGDAPYKSAVAHAALIEKVRPHFVREGIMWRPIQVLPFERGSEWIGTVPSRSGGERHMKFCRMHTTVRFECVDDPKDYIDVPVVTDAYDDTDKGSAKASTYADKSAILLLLNLEKGDDPDFDPSAMDLGADSPITERIVKLRSLIAEHPDYKSDPEAYERGTLVTYAQTKGRHRVPTIYHLSEDQLDKWIKKLTEEIQSKEAGDGSGKQTAHKAGSV